MSTDALNIENVKNGDHNAFRQLMDTHARRIYALALDLANDPQDAEDLTQEVFIKMYNNIDQFRGDASLYSWLHRITVNTWINMKRSKIYKKKTMEQSIYEEKYYHENDENLVTNPEELTDLQKHIENSMNTLSKKERLVFVLRHYHDQSLKEIAETTHLKTGTIKSLLFRAVKKLRKNMAYYQHEVA